jgi:hypothetical protein
MADKEISPAERAARGKRLLFYGMFSLVVVTFVTVFLVLWLLSLGSIGIALRTSLIVTVVTVIACAIVWFLYTKAILKE